MPDGDISCANCRYSVPVFVGYSRSGEQTPTPVLECHRYPPQQTPNFDEPDEPGVPTPMMVSWVQVDGGDWCGEFGLDSHG